MGQITLVDHLSVALSINYCGVLLSNLADIGVGDTVSVRFKEPYRTSHGCEHLFFIAQTGKWPLGNASGMEGPWPLRKFVSEGVASGYPTLMNLGSKGSWLSVGPAQWWRGVTFFPRNESLLALRLEFNLVVWSFIVHPHCKDFFCSNAGSSNLVCCST